MLIIIIAITTVFPMAISLFFLIQISIQNNLILFLNFQLLIFITSPRLIQLGKKPILMILNKYKQSLMIIIFIMMIRDKKQQNIITTQNEDNSNLKLTITYFTFNKKIESNLKNQGEPSKQPIFMVNRMNNTSYKSRNQMNKIYSRRKNFVEGDKEDNNHIIFTGQKGNAETKNNMFLTWRERHNKLISSNNRESIIQDIIKKIKSTQIKSQNRMPYLTYEEQSNTPTRLKMKNRWQSSKEVHTPIQLISRKLQCDKVKSSRQPKKQFQIRTMKKPILLSKFMDINKQKSCILRISGWQANYGGFQDYNYNI